MMSPTWTRTTWVSLCTAVLLSCAVGCSTPKKAAEQPVFYPPPPETPRLQFLTSYARAKDLDPPDRFLTFLVGEEPEARHVVKPYGMAINDGKLFVCDTILGGLEILDLTARTFDYFTPAGPGRLRKPINVAVDDDGTRYVADALRGQVVLFDREGEYRGAIGNVEETRPSDVLIARDRLYVTDLKQSHVAV